MSASPAPDQGAAPALHRQYVEAEARLRDLAATLERTRLRLRTCPDSERTAPVQANLDRLGTQLRRTEVILVAAHQALLQARPLPPMVPASPARQGPAASLLRHPGVMSLNPTGRKTPLFLVPPGSDGLSFFHLSRCWDLDRPMHVLLPPGLAPDEAIVASAPELVAHHLAALRRVQPHGPYMLGGYCVGGLFAHEIARQLTGAGEDVAFLGLIDGFIARSRWRVAVDRLWHPLRRLPHHLCALVRLPPRRWPGYLAGLDGLAPGDLRSLLRLARPAPHPPVEAPRGERAMAAKRRAFVRHRPQPWAGRAHLFLTAGPWQAGRLKPDLSWERLVRGGVERVTIAGTHADCLEGPNVVQWSATFLAALDRAEPGM
jgi:thioesterase domain-containing protein